MLLEAVFLLKLFLLLKESYEAVKYLFIFAVLFVYRIIGMGMYCRLLIMCSASNPTQSFFCLLCCYITFFF